MLLDFPQLENQIKRTSEGSIQREELETQRDVILAAQNLQLIKMETLEITQIKKCALVVISHGKMLPLFQKIFITFRSSTSLEADADDELWIGIITLVIADGPWSIPSPRFGALELQYVTDVPGISYICQYWASSAITDKFIRLIGDVEGGYPPGANRKQLASLCMTFLKKVGPDPDVEYPETFRALISHVKKAYRGIAALANPRPCVGDLSDVRYVMPSTTTAPIVDDIPRFGRVILSKLRKTEWWPKEMKEFEACVGSEHLAGPIVNKVELDLVKLKDHFEQAAGDAQKELALLNELHRSSVSLSDKQGDWKQCFRTGGLNDMSKAFLMVMEYVVGNVGRARESCTSIPYFIKGMLAVSSLHTTDEPKTVQRIEDLLSQLQCMHTDDVGRATVNALQAACAAVAGSTGATSFPFQDMEAVTRAVVSMVTSASKLEEECRSAVSGATQVVVRQLASAADVGVSADEGLSLEELKTMMGFFDNSGPGSIATDVSSVREHAQLHGALSSFGAVGTSITQSREAFADGNAGERRASVRMLGTKLKAAEADMGKRLEGPAGGALACLNNHTGPHLARSRATMQELSSRLLREDITALQDAMAVLEPIAGGASGGLWWWASQKDYESVIDVYNRTLGKVTKATIERASTVVQQAAL